MTHNRQFPVRRTFILMVLAAVFSSSLAPAFRLQAAEVRRVSGESVVVRQISEEDLPSSPTVLPGPDLPPHPMPPADQVPWVTGGPCEEPAWSRGGPEPLGVLYGLDYWARAEYLFWWRPGQDLPPLVTGGPDGVLPQAPVLFGNETVADEGRHGGRFTFGLPLDDHGCWALAARVAVLDESTVSFQLSSDDTPVIGRPFFNTGLNGQDAFLLASPGAATGNISVSSHSDLASAELILQRLWFTTDRSRVDFIFGYQAAQIDEALRIHSLSTITNTGETIEVTDLFDVSNEFYGGHLGILAQYQNHRWGMELLAKVALGNMNHFITIDGATTTVSGNATNTVASGLLVQSTNIGEFDFDQFTVNPELNLNVTYRLNECVDLVFGYSFLYWNNVVRATDTLDVDLAVNPNQPPPAGEPERPSFEVRSTDFWAQGINAGVNIRF